MMQSRARTREVSVHTGSGRFRFGLIGLIAGILLVGISGSDAQAGKNRECKLAAKAVYLDCKTLCKEERRMDKDMCRNIDHECAELCRAERDACLLVVFQQREGCFLPCETTLDAAKIGCRAQFPKGSVARDVCIDAAQIVAFICRDTCREGFSGDLRGCRVDNKTCIQACPPDVDPNAPTDLDSP